MAYVNVMGPSIGTQLQQLLLADDIVPGSDAGYELAKQIYVYHPLGKKLADTPITLAQSQPREITIANAPERVKERFLEQWKTENADVVIFRQQSLSRIYGVAAIGILVDGLQPGDPLDYDKLPGADISFNIWDALNLAGSQVLDLNPNSMAFLKPVKVTAAGTSYHRSRAIVKIHEQPIYLDYSNSAFGFTGRSVYQRALYPLKSFIRTMITDEMVARKAGLLVAKMKPAGSITDGLMTRLFGVKRQMLQEGQTDNVLGITPEESIETLNMQNVNTAMEVSRKNILDNIATAADMPAVILNQETFAEGFGEGSEDAKSVARYIGGVRDDMQPSYDWMDVIVMYRAWTPEFYATIKAEYPDQYGDMPFNTAFQEWRNAFRALWPNLIEEPDSEKILVEDVKLKAIIATYQVFEPTMPDQENKAELASWAQDNLNESEMVFQIPLNLDLEAIADYVPPEPIDVAGEGTEGEGAEPKTPRPFSAADANESVRKLTALADRRRMPRATAA